MIHRSIFIFQAASLDGEDNEIHIKIEQPKLTDLKITEHNDNEALGLAQVLSDWLTPKAVQALKSNL